MNIYTSLILCERISSGIHNNNNNNDNKNAMLHL